MFHNSYCKNFLLFIKFKTSTVFNIIIVMFTTCSETVLKEF